MHGCIVAACGLHVHLHLPLVILSETAAQLLDQLYEDSPERFGAFERSLAGDSLPVPSLSSLCPDLDAQQPKDGRRGAEPWIRRQMVVPGPRECSARGHSVAWDLVERRFLSTLERSRRTRY